VSDTSTGSGYAFHAADGMPALLAATNRRTAARPAVGVPRPPAGRASGPARDAANEWAIDVGLAARSDLVQEGYLALRDMRPPAPYLHHGSLL
jgi:hypothetical protein